jgi:hypothetical protein
VRKAVVSIPRYEPETKLGCVAVTSEKGVAVDVWNGPFLAFALWLPLLTAWVATVAWGAWQHRGRAAPYPPHARGAAERSLPLSRSFAPTSTSTLHALLDAADDRATAYLESLACAAVDPARLEHRRGAFEVSTLVALLMVRDWTARADDGRLGLHAAPVVEAIRTGSGEALFALFASPRLRGADGAAPSLGESATHARRLRALMAEVAAELRTYRQARSATGIDPYR